MYWHLPQVALSRTRAKGSSDLFTTLSTHTCVCLHWLTLKLAKIIKIAHCNRPKIALKCCWYMMQQNPYKNTLKIRFIYGPIRPDNKDPPPSFRECVTNFLRIALLLFNCFLIGQFYSERI